MTQRKLASVQIIRDILPIEGADRIELAKVLGWQVVCKKGEFQVGDKAIYFEIDSILPRASWSEFLVNKDKPDRPIRLKTCKFKKSLSQGLIVSPSILLEQGMTQENIDSLPAGTDLTAVIGIQKYEPEIPAQLAGKVLCPFPTHLAYKTDEIRIQSEPDLLKEFAGKEVYLSQKMDGTSGTFIKSQGELHVCSRNLSLKETEGNTYWDIYNRIIKPVFDEMDDVCIQGEICGPGIQKNRLGLSKTTLYVFNVYDIANRRFLNYRELVEFCKRYGLEMVPVLDVRVFDFAGTDQLLKLAVGKYESGYPQEGIVIRPTEEFYSQTLQSRASFKVINNDFLLKSKE